MLISWWIFCKKHISIRHLSDWNNMVNNLEYWKGWMICMWFVHNEWFYRPLMRLWKSIMGVWLLTMRQRRHSSQSWKGVFNLKRNYEAFRFFFIICISGSPRDIRMHSTLQSNKIQPFCTIISTYSTHYYLLGKTLWSVLVRRIWWCIRPIFQKDNVLIRNHSKLFGYFKKMKDDSLISYGHPLTEC